MAESPFFLAQFLEQLKDSLLGSFETFSNNANDARKESYKIYEEANRNVQGQIKVIRRNVKHYSLNCLVFSGFRN
jgi:hypothetical protein